MLDKNDWARYVAVRPDEAWPYGLTHVSLVRPHVAVIPADDAGIITQGLLADRVHATPKTYALLNSVHLTFDEAGRKFIFYPTLHEVGHTLGAEYGIQVMGGAGSAWLNELLASYFAYAFEESKRPQTATIVDAVAEMSSVPVKYTRLEEFAGDRAHGFRRLFKFLCYQHQFESQVAKVFAKQGIDFLAKVKAEFPSGSKTELTPGEVITKLERISPGFRAWQSQMADFKITVQNPVASPTQKRVVRDQKGSYRMAH